MHHQLFNILDELIIRNTIRINRDELKLQLQTHPSYPSLHALTGVLNHFGIQNLALRVPISEEILTQLPPFFIANILKDDAQQLVLIQQKKQKIKVIYDRGQSKQMPIKQFLNDWTGILLAIEKDEHVQEVKTVFPKQFAYLTLFVISGLLMLIQSNNPVDIYFYLHFLLSWLGLFISTIIIRHEIGWQSEIANRWCNQTEKTSCDAVLQSKGATLFGGVKLSDLCLVLFATYLLFGIGILLNMEVSYTPTIYFSWLSLIGVIYSVVYQYYIVKKWCPLCLGISGILLSQAGVIFFAKSFLVNWQSSFYFIGAGLIIASTWYLLRPFLEKQIRLQNIEIQHYRFKRNFDLFKTLYDKEKKLQHNTSIPGEINLGNPKGPLQLTLITNPLCYHCQKAHQDIEHILNNTDDNVLVSIRFNVNTEDKDSIDYRVATQLLHIYNHQGQETCRKALSEVYSDKANLEEWLASQSLSLHPIYEDSLNIQKQWCDQNSLHFTPTFFVHNNQLPSEYNRTDLLYFVDDLIEHIAINNDSTSTPVLTP